MTLEVIEILTALLVVITGIYAYLTHKIAKATETSVAVIREQLAIAEKSANAAAKSADAAREEFVATHRPRLRLRRAFAAQGAPDEAIEVTLFLANVGETPCRLVGSAAALKLITGATFEPEAGVELEGEQPNVLISPGGEFSIALISPMKWGQDSAITHEFDEPDRGLILYGQFLYLDDSPRQVPRRMSFKRRYNFRNSHFYLAEPDSPFEYSD